MKHIKQGLNQCFPTVLAMLTDRDVNEIIAKAQAISPTIHDWNSALTGPCEPGDAMSLTFKALARRYAPYLLDYVDPVNVKEIADSKRFLDYYAFIRLTAKGKGAIVECSRYISQPGGHIAAFENGLVYDGNLDGPISAREYFKFLATKTTMCPFAVVSEY